MKPLLQLSAIIRMLRGVVDPGVLLQQAPGQQPGPVTPGGRPSRPTLLVKRPLICELIAPLYNLQPVKCLSTPLCINNASCSVHPHLEKGQHQIAAQIPTTGHMTCCNSRQKVPEVFVSCTCQVCTYCCILIARQGAGECSGSDGHLCSVCSGSGSGGHLCCVWSESVGV